VQAAHLAQADFGQGLRGLPGRPQYYQTPAPFWAGLVTFFRLLTPAAMAAVVAWRPSLRESLLQHVAVLLHSSGSSRPEPEATGSALEALRLCVKVKFLVGPSQPCTCTFGAL
jgi:hypothetical protein